MGRTSSRAGLDIANASIQLLHPAAAPPDQPYGWTLDQAAEKIGHLTGSKAELLEAVAYLTCQMYAYKKSSNEDASLAIVQIENIVSRYREGRKGNE